MPPLASPPCSTPQQALAFVAAHGIVLVSARGSVPCLTEAIAGAPIKGSWWGHPAGKQIFAILEQVVDSGQVLVCRLIDGKYPNYEAVIPKGHPGKLVISRVAVRMLA